MHRHLTPLSLAVLACIAHTAHAQSTAATTAQLPAVQVTDTQSAPGSTLSLDAPAPPARAWAFQRAKRRPV